MEQEGKEQGREEVIGKKNDRQGQKLNKERRERGKREYMNGTRCVIWLPNHHHLEPSN